MDHGISSLSELQALVAGDQRQAWVKLISTISIDGQNFVLDASVFVGSKPQNWKSLRWEYENCQFIATEMIASTFAPALHCGEPSRISINGFEFEFNFTDNPVSWQRSPSNSPFEVDQIGAPHRVFFLRLENANQIHIPAGYLIGGENVPSFSSFNEAYEVFSRSDGLSVNPVYPNLGQVTIKIVDARGRIRGVEKLGETLQIEIEGDDLAHARLEIHSGSRRSEEAIGDQRLFNFDLPDVHIPSNAWIWLKSDQNWIDYWLFRLEANGEKMEFNSEVSERPGSGQSEANSNVNSGGVRLREEAIKRSRRAISAYAADDLSDFFTFAGQAVELAAKSRLAAENLAFLAPSNKFAESVALWNAHDDFSRLRSGVRTIGGREALERLMILDSGLQLPLEGARELLEFRNGEIHLGIVDSTARNRVFISLLRSINAILHVEDQGIDQIWAPHGSLVRTTLDDNAKRIHSVVQMKVSAAIEYFKKFAALPSEQREVVLSMLANRADGLEIECAKLPCPACKSPAIASGTNSMEYDDVELDEDDNVYSYRRYVTFYATSLKCEVCQLHLDGAEELIAAGIPVSWQNSDSEVFGALMDMEFENSQYADVSEIEIDEEDQG